MILHQDKFLRCITQSDHARFAGELLSLWRTDGLPEHSRRQALLFATREHDNGWLEADSAPRIDRETGGPLSFRDLPASDLLDVWERGTARYINSHPTAALLILQHSIELHRARSGDPGWENYLQRSKGLRDELLEESEMTSEMLRLDYGWLALSDGISLALCENRLPASIERCDQTIRIVPDRAGFSLEPFPFAGTTTFRIPCRRVRGKGYASDAEFGIELAEATWEAREVKLTARSPGP